MLGSAIVEAFSQLGHEVLRISRGGVVRVDIEQPDSIAAMYEAVGMFDAVVVAAGASPMGRLQDLTRRDFRIGLENKFLGQVDLVLQGVRRINDGGSFTLVSGATSLDPIKDGSVLSAINGAIDAFVASAGLDLPRGIRINSVNAPVFTEAFSAYERDFPGWESVSVASVARAFVKSTLGIQTGKTFYVR
jgi:NAD(P)-dependent dehydrogenase (short-subunit alcohol dehydrogenase family)